MGTMDLPISAGSVVTPFSCSATRVSLTQIRHVNVSPVRREGLPVAGEFCMIWVASAWLLTSPMRMRAIRVRGWAGLPRLSRYVQGPTRLDASWRTGIAAASVRIKPQCCSV
jgi:hypothetical protein